MDKKNTSLLSVIAIATLLVAVVGATFAYFTSTDPTVSSINTSVKTSAGTATFTSSAVNTELNIVADSAFMVQENNNTSLSQSGSITAQLVGVSSTETTTCTYKIKYTWTSAATSGVYYTPTDSSVKELTLAVTKNASSTDTSADSSNYTEQNIPGTAASTDLITAGSIKSVNGATVTDKWDVTMKFYNINKSQDSQKNKTYTGKVELYNVNCTTTTTT